MKEHTADLEQILKDGQTVQFPVTGWSMYPFLHDGDLVTVSPASDSDIAVNNVLLYRRPNGPLILHRLMKTDEDGLYFCGDNHCELEGPLPRSQIIGVLTGYIHRNSEVSTASLSYQTASSLWRILHPVRQPIITAVKKIRRHG